MFPRLCILLAVLAVAAAVRGEDARFSPAPQSGLLVLRNGQTIAGKITRAGDLYYVTFPKGEIRVQSADVEFTCGNLEEAYRRKRAAAKIGDAQSHLRMARWCLQQDLLSHAAAELADAWDAEPDHPMIDVLERRLRLALEVRKEPQRALPPPKPTPPLEELKQIVRTVPPGSVEEFTATVQPILSNGCATAACHGPGSTAKFRLVRIPIGQPPSRQTTLGNLRAALEWIDRDTPKASRLLTVPLDPHGTAESPVFGKHDAVQYARLVDWVYHVAGRTKPPAASPVAAAEQPAAEAVNTEPKTVGGKPSKGTVPRLLPAEPSAAKPIAAFDPKNPFAGGSGGTSAVVAAGHQGRPKSPVADILPSVGPRVQRGARIERFVPVDPFDPEIFNRRYFGKKAGGEASNRGN